MQSPGRSKLKQFFCVIHGHHWGKGGENGDAMASEIKTSERE